MVPYAVINKEELRRYLEQRVKETMKPDELRTVVDQAVRDSAQKGMTADVLTLASFSPSWPNPTHRYNRVV